MPLYRHPSLVVFRIRPQAAAFLKQYTTQEIGAPLAVFLTREGRSVAAVRQAKLSDDEALIVLGRDFAPKLAAHLKPYLNLSATKMEPSPEFTVYFDPSDAPARAEDFVIPEKAGHFLVSEDANRPAAWTEADYTRFRVENGIPEQGIDFEDELPLCVDPSWVHFDKGCYLGQEIIARVHYRGTPPKRLVVKTESECTPDQARRLTSRIETGAGVAGFVFV